MKPKKAEQKIAASGLRGMTIFMQLEDQLLPDLEFLKDFGFLRALRIVSRDDLDLEVLQHLQQLEELAIISPGSKSIPIDRLPILRELDICWRPKVLPFQKRLRALQSLTIWEYSEKDLEQISAQRGLRKLVFNDAKIESLKGIENLRNLKHLELGHCRKLASLQGMEHCPNLETLEIDQCPKINDFERLGANRKLKSLELIDCGTVSTIKFITLLPRLNHFKAVGKIKIEDGDITPLRNIPSVRLRPFDHYFPEDLAQEIEARMQQRKS